MINKLSFLDDTYICSQCELSNDINRRFVSSNELRTSNKITKVRNVCRVYLIDKKFCTIRLLILHTHMKKNECKYLCCSFLQKMISFCCWV